MPAKALARQPDANSLPQTGKRERIPPRIAKAVKLLVSGECKTQKAAAERSGITATHLCEMLTRAKIQAFVARETRRAIQNGTMQATATLIRLLDAKSDPTAAQVAQRILTDQGILKADQTHTTNVDVRVAGYIINLADPAPKVIDATIVTKAEKPNDNNDVLF